MAKTASPRVNEDHKYTVQESEPLLELTAETIKKKCRSGEIKGIQKGLRKVAYQGCRDYPSQKALEP